MKTLLILFLFLLFLNLVYSFPKDISKAINNANKENKQEVKSQRIINNKSKILEDNLSSENLKKERISQEEYNKERIEDLEKPKSLEEFLSQYNFDKNTLKNNKVKTSSEKSNEEKESNLNKNEEQKGSKEASIDSSNLPTSAGRNQAFLDQTSKSSLKEPTGEKEEGSTLENNNPPEMSLKDRMLQNPSPGEGLPENTKQTGSLPGTEERETKLGEAKSQRRVFSGEKIYVPPSLSEKEGKNYLFQAPTLEGRRKASGSNINLNPSYEEENPTASRILPKEFQEILKLYFSQ
ncbi:MAG: hypothetical protein ACP5K6_05545 [Dictyoglomus sp.]|uniref:hypothetical protein n=1 Tax=Dictyoglomus sp. TaxID=28205 RepID=UPI003D11CDF8